jgi:putative FmdB family regulatory protein
MPIYEYRCHNCGKTTEIMQKISDQPIKRCSYCSGKVSKIISHCTFQLKGSGWYVTDYKKKDSGLQDKKTEAKKGTSSASETVTSTSKSSKSSEEKG